MLDAAYWIEHLDLSRHPEGGYYRETYRSIEQVPGKALPPRYGGDRSFSTAIYFLLERNDFSAFHRIRSDEIWHLYGGGPLNIYCLDQGNVSTLQLGTDLDRGEKPQITVAGGRWFAAEVADPGTFALAGCTVAPGFDFADFEMADGENLCRLYPGQKDLIEKLTRRR